MIRTKPAKGTVSQQLALELFSSDAYLTLNKKLLKTFGPEKSIFLSNLIDKFKYFRGRGMLEDDWFFLDREREMQDTGLTNYARKKCKKELKADGILSVKKKGVPARDWIKINFDAVLESTNSTALVESNSTAHNNKELKYNDNKNNKIPQDKKSDNFTPLQFHIAEQLYNIILSKKNIRYTPSQIKTWARDIHRLVKQSGVSTERVEKALNWYANHIGEKYTPVIESGRSLREKFLKLEAAIERDREGQPALGESISAKEILDKYFGSQSHRWCKYCFQPLLDIVSDKTFTDGQAKLARQLTVIHSWFTDRQKIPDLIGREQEEIYGRWQAIPNAFGVVEGFVRWLGEQRWLEDIYPAHLHPEGMVFQQFLTKYQRDIGLNFFDGSFIT